MYQNYKWGELSMEKRKVRKVNYFVTGNGQWIENRDCFVEQQFPPGGSFVRTDRIPKSGQNLTDEFHKRGYELEPGKYIKTEKIEY